MHKLSSKSEEFGANFGWRLLKVMRNDEHQNSHRPKNLVERFNGTVFTWLCDFGRLRFYGNFNEVLGRRRQKRLTFGEKLKKLRNTRTRWSRKRWPYVLLAVWLISVLLLTINIYFQYIYDANNAKLKRIRAHLSGTEPLLGANDHLNFTLLQVDFTTRAAEARATLRRLGAPRLDWSFVAESIVLLFIISGTNLYIYMPLTYHLNQWPLLAPLRIIDPDYEHKVCTQLVLEQLRRFAAESVSFGRTKLISLYANLAATFVQYDQRQRPAIEIWGRRVVFRHIEQCHKLVVAQLKAVALEGRLKHLNRSAEACNRLEFVWCRSILFTGFYLQAIASVANVYLRYYFRSKGVTCEFLNLNDYLHVFYLLLLAEIHVISSIFMGSILIAVWYDQSATARLLRTLIRTTIDSNNRRVKQLIAINNEHNFQRHHHHQQADAATLKSSIEQDLLVVAIQFRVVRKLFKLSRYPMSLFAFGAIWFSVVVLVTFRLHSPYFGQEMGNINLARSFAGVTCTFIYLIPLCQMHQQTLKGFGELWSLVAQLSCFETIPQVNETLKLDSNVALFIMRRELADWKASASRLACSVFSLPITSQNCIRIAVWALIFVVSISGKINFVGKGFAVFSNDPFGLFQFGE